MTDPRAPPHRDDDYLRRKRLLALIKRANQLTRRIESNPDRNLSFDVAERAALQWAVEELRKLYPRALPDPTNPSPKRTE